MSLKKYNIALNVNDILLYHNEDTYLIFDNIFVSLIEDLSLNLNLYFWSDNKNYIINFERLYESFLNKVNFVISHDKLSYPKAKILYNIISDKDLRPEYNCKFMSTYNDYDSYIHALYNFFSFIKAYDNNKILNDGNINDKNRNNGKQKFYRKKYIKRIDLETKQ